MSSPDERKLTISGVKVVFPCKPYPSQFGMMDRVIKGLERKQNSLLESPTGSGKSLALLCSALAWQVAQNEKITKENMNADSVGCSKPCQCHASDAGRSTEYSPESKPGYTSKADGGKVIDVSDEEVNEQGDDDDEDFKPSAKIRTPILGQGKGKKRRHLGIQYEDEPDCCTDNPPVKCTCNTSGPTEAMKKQKLPKIYFGTRTHKQIAQITRELKKTAYHDARMVILASREYTCIHPEVTIQKNKSEGCRERLDINGPGCKFNDKSKRVFLSQRQLQDEIPTAWDLEDLVSSCTKKKACPYFVTRNLKEGADIIFCPYNYLIDPLVRKSMDITLKDQIVILDEAHNIEDCARDAASGSVTTDQITQSILNLQQLMEHNIKYVEHLKLRNMLESLLNFIEGNNSNLDQSDYDTSYKVWSGFDIVVRLKGIGLGPDSFQEYQRCFEQAVAQNDDEAMAVRDRRNKEVKMSSNTQKILEQLFQILDYMYRDDLKFVEDYRVAIMKSMQYVSNRDTGDRWLGKNRRGGSRIVVFTLNFWCMNPAVAFSDFSSCRNVVLSSGTLSPMSSFASELGTPFPIQLEANHIIEDKQVFVGAVGVGPSGNQLQAVYRNMETFTFQDELGNLIHQVCTKVPHGVLCFLPSYRALEKFIDRWKLTGLWNKLSTRKRVMVEPRAADREDFDGMMKAFYEVVKRDLYNPYLDEAECNDDDSEIDGALFFAVCRGKVSEGMDFADDNARAVITVGIPYPSFKDVQVKLKREYNDKHKIDRGLLSGGDWYEIQAFRALNQALGRCIRHRKDWGALIIVDDRFVKRTEKYCKSLSRWVRSKVQTFDVFSDFLTSMSNFTEKMIKEMPKVSPDTSFIPSTPCDDRRDKRHSLDNSYLNSTIQASPYFTSPPLSQSPDLQNLFRTPETSSKRLITSPSVPVFPGVTSPTVQQQLLAGVTSPTVHQHVLAGVTSPTIQQQVLTGVTSLNIQQQILNVINSGTGPKDQPDYIIVNQGTPSEQTFLIEPNKHGGNQQMPAQMPSMVPPIVPLTQAAGQQVVLNMPGTNQHQTILLTMPQLPVQGTNLPQSAAIPGTSLKSDFRGGNQLDKTNSTDGIKAENVSKAEKKADIVFTLGSSTLSAEEQLKKFVSSSQAPRNQAYYVVVNKGETNERAFFIEPNKNGKSKPNTEKKIEAEKTDDSLVKTLDPVKTEDKKPVKIEQEVVVPDSSTGDPEPQNKFLKFCQLPKTPAKVPVAAVTPQRQSEQEIKTETADSVKEEQGSLLQTMSKSSHNPQTTSTSRQVQPTCTSPVLFEDGQADGPAPDSVNKTNNLAVLDKEHSTKKKPIFKKGNSLSSKTLKSEIEDCKGTSKDGDINIDEVNNDKDNADDFKEECKGGRRTKPTTRGKVDMSVVDKVQQGRKKSDDVLQETKDKKNVGEELLDGESASGNDVNSDEEFLNTRRRGGRKRKSTSKFQEWSKRSRKGVTYDDNENTDEKENKARSQCLSCIKCGKQFLPLGQYEKQKKHPEFLTCVFKKNTELIYFPNMKANDCQLQTVESETNNKGLLLNSVYDETLGCCIQYLQCIQCKNNTVIGARVLLADSSSLYTAGQVFVGAVGVGPSGNQLQAVYRNMETFTFQDELGNLIHQVCTKVPHGVLCFLPSYRALEKFIDRWKLTGLWNKLSTRKRVMVEPRAADREDFDGMMKAFYEVVKGDLYNPYLDEGECNDDDSEIDGALFFAVCRGKVSEGMDFADDNARAVITVGIPYPSFKDVQVKLKREYNDKHKIDRGLLSGGDWYEIQAFRALNQALGRCIRHRKDWGALIIVDDRFVKRTEKYCKSLSRWVRSKVQTFDVFSDFLTSMSNFTEKMIKEMPKVSPDTSFIPSTPCDDRKDSVYKRHSLDNSYLNSTIQASPYFTSPPLSQSPDLQNLFRTPETSSKRRSVTSPAVPMFPGVTSPTVHQQVLTGVTSLNIQQQIMNVINSGTGPKDQPYYIIVNQGTSSEQTFLIEPNKHGGNQQMPAQMLSMVPPIVPLTQAAGQQVVLNMPGTSQHQTVLLTMPQLPVQGTNLPQSATIPGTSLKSDFRGGNQLGKTNSTDGIKSENVSKEEKKADIVFTLGSSTLSAEEQLKKFVSSSQAPRNQAYYVVVNKGETNERAFFIEPNKKGKSKPNTEKKIEAEKTDDSLVKTLDPVKTEDKKPVKIEQEVVVPDSSTGDPEPQNKFLKFCQLPKTPAKVPVAAVTPQRQSEQEIKTETVDSVKEEPGSSPQTLSKSSHNPQTTSTSRQVQPTCTSPVLFEDGQADEPAPDSVDKTNNLADLDKEHSTKKKPIFKKRNSLSTKTLKSEIEDCKGKSKDGDSNIDEVNNDKDNTDDFKDESKGGRRIKSTTRGKVDLSVVDKVKQGRKKSDDVLQEAKDKNVGEELLDGESASGNDVNSDEEFLNTRRRGGRKRKSTSKFQEWSKRSRKGVTYEDNENTDEKENKARNQCLSCIKCGKQLLPLGQYEKQKKHPEFLTCVFKKNTELIYFPNMKTKDCQLQTVECETNNKGLLLNSVYDETLGCCIQYLQCRQCKTDTVIGARVLLADSTSLYTAGQTWILSSAAKL